MYWLQLVGVVEKTERGNRMRLIAYFMHHMKNKTVVLSCRNVKGLEDNPLVEIAREFGYDIAQYNCKPADVGSSVGRLGSS